MEAPKPDYRTLLHRTVAELDYCAHLLERHFPRPRLISGPRLHAYRHAADERTDLLAAHLKCLRAVSALNSSLVLLDYGQIQDVYALCRIIDEQQEDVAFLSADLGEDGKPSQDQVRFLNEFYQEEFRDDVALLDSSVERDRVPRKKIRAALARTPMPNTNPSDLGSTTRLVFNTFSGFVHGAYVHIMEQYNGASYLTKPSGHPRINECAAALADYIYRACAATVMVAIRCQDKDVEQRLRAAMDAFAAVTGCLPSAEEMKKIHARVKAKPQPTPGA